MWIILQIVNFIFQIVPNLLVDLINKYVWGSNKGSQFT